MKATGVLFGILLIIEALNNTHSTVYNQCLLFIRQDLPGSDFQLKLSVTLYFCAIFFVRCIIGSIADRCSGRKCLLIMLFVVLGGHLLAYAATNLPIFVVARFIQGFGFGGGQVMSLVLLMQLFPNKNRASIIAAEQVVFCIAAVCLPLVGHACAVGGHWRWTYVMYILLTLFAIAYFYGCQHHEEHIAASMVASHEPSHHLITDKKFMLPVVMAALTASSYCLWGSYFSLIVRHYDIHLSWLIWYQLLPLVPYFFFSLYFPKLTKNIPQRTLFRRIACTQGTVFGLILLLLLWNKNSAVLPLLILIPVLLHNVASAFFRPLMQGRALNAVPVHQVGSAGAFISIFQVAANAVFSVFINCMADFLPAFVLVQLFINICILLYLWRDLRNGSPIKA